MSLTLRWMIAIAAIAAPLLHSVSDGMEWIGGGFSPIQLLINYVGFLLIPFVMVGLYAVQRSQIGWVGCFGAVIYGIAFIYFAHTTLFALNANIAHYEMLLRELGGVYVLHSGLMILGGILFGVASWRAQVLWRGAVWLFLMGLGLNLSVALLPLPDILQTVGSLVRNLGLVTMGLSVLRSAPRHQLHSD